MRIPKSSNDRLITALIAVVIADIAMHIADLLPDDFENLFVESVLVVIVLAAWATYVTGMAASIIIFMKWKRP